MDPQPFDRSRESVTAYLRDHFRLENFANAFQNLHDFTLRLTELGLKVVALALADLLTDPSPSVRLQAAWWLRMFRRNAPAEVRRDQDERAARVLVHALQEGDDEARLLPAILLGLGGGGPIKAPPLPSEALPALTGMLDESDARLNVAAAVALVGTDADDCLARAVEVLSQALTGNDPNLSLMAAGGFGRIRMRTKEVVSRLVQMLPVAAPEVQFRLVKALEEMGAAAVPAVTDLVDLLRDESAHPTLRAAIAGALGTICAMPEGDEPRRRVDAREAARTALTWASASSVWPVVWSAVDGLKATGGVPAEVIQLLIGLLGDDDEDVRGMSALALSEAGPLVTLAVPALLDRLGREPHPGVCQMVVKALAAAGPAALPPLIELLREQEPKTLLLAAEAINQLGRVAVPEVAETLLADADEPVRDLAVALLQRLGPRAVAAVPVATRLMGHADPGVREHAVMAVLFIGSPAKAAVPDLIRALSDPHRDIAHWAQKALVVIGPDAVPALRTAKPEDAGARERVAQLLAHLAGTGSGPAADGFEWVGDDDKLVLFAWVGQNLLARRVSGRALAKELAGLVESGAWRQAPATTEPTLRYQLVALRNTLRRTLGGEFELIRSEGRKSLVLTPEGKDLLGRVMTYLRKKGLLVTPGAEPGRPSPKRPG